MRIFVLSLTRKTIALLSCAALAVAALGTAAVFAPKDYIPIYSVKTNGNQIALTLDVAWGSQTAALVLTNFCV